MVANKPLDSSLRAWPTRLRSLLVRLGRPGTWLLVVLWVLLLPLANPRIAATDEVQYYVYLRSLRFDGDFDFANEYRRFAELNPKSGIEQSLLMPDRIRATGRYGNVAPIGAALMWSPFFLLADLGVHLANALGAHIPADGFSRPYILAVCYASSLYGLLGLLLCERLARRYASGFAATLATLTLWLASPLLFYMVVQMPFAHATGFFLVALFLTLWNTTRQEPGTKNRAPQSRGLAAPAPATRSARAWLALALVGALMTMTREQLGLFLLLPAAEGLADYARLARAGAWRDAAQLAARHALFLVVFALALTPQLVTYKILNGVFAPASEVSGKFNLCSPHMLDTLLDFDPRPSAWCHVAERKVEPAFAHGALLWTPVLLPALVGLAWLWRRDRLLCAVLVLGFVGQVYLNGAFSTWHLTSAFGFRRLIECTPIFVVGLALLLDALGARGGRVARGALVALALLFIAWNIALIANWTVFNDVTRLRDGMQWPQLFHWQIEVPQRLASRAGQLLFDRCALMQNGCR